MFFFVASRGHRAEIGGLTPGSMPAFSRQVHDEGVLFDGWLLVRGGVLRERETRDLLASALYPSRNPDTIIADLRAQIAANEKGVAEVRAMIAHFGLDVVQAYMGHVQDNAEEAVRRVIAELDDGQYLLRDGGRSGDRCRGAGGPGAAGRRPSASRVPATNSTPTSTPRARWPVRRCCTCFPSPWTTTSRSTTDACVRCTSSSPSRPCSPPTTRQPWWPATWRRRRRSAGPVRRPRRAGR